MAALSIQSITRAGLTATYAACSSGGDTAVNDGKTFIHIFNAGVATPTVTIDSLVNCNQGFDHNVTVTIPASDDIMIGPFPANRFNASDNTGIQISYSSETDLTIAALSIA